MDEPGNDGPIAEAWQVELQFRNLMKEGQYALAASMGEQLLELREAELGPDHVDVAAIASGLAETYLHLTLHDRARELLERARSGDVVLLDARPAAEYRAGHLPGAVSIPVEEIEQHLSELPPNKEVVAYCRGPYCVMALDAVRKLRASGRKARRFAEGYPEWRAAGLPTEASVEA